MIRAKIKIPEYNWDIYVYIAVREIYTYEILAKMHDLGASKNNILNAHKNLTDGLPNGGITFSNPQRRVSLCVIETATSGEECFDTIVHEIRHIEQHIANTYEIDENSEDVCYLCGRIAHLLYPYVIMYLSPYSKARTKMPFRKYKQC